MEVRHATREDRRSQPRYTLLPTLLTFIALLPILLSPSHPVAVYGYLAHALIAPLFAPPAEGLHGELAEFLVAPAQVDRFRHALRADLLDRRGGGLFVIVRDGEGRLRHAPLRTWNSFLPAAPPGRLGDWLDRKEFPYLGDAVGLWLSGDVIVATGHYHPFGGGPSAGDRRAQALSRHVELVVSNGVVPMIYMEGEVIPYGEEVTLPQDVYRNLRALEKGLLMEVKDIPLAATVPSDRMASFLAYLRDYRQVDLSCTADVARELSQLCAEFKRAYRYVFRDGLQPIYYLDDPDTYTLLHNLKNVEMWAANMGERPRHLVLGQNGRAGDIP